MRDPLPSPPQWLVNFTIPYANAVHLPTLPYHIHEVLAAAVFYQTVESVVSPALSTYFFPHIYPKFNTRTRINWDVHVVSFVQSCFINTLALWVIFTDGERKDMDHAGWVERVYGYTGACGMIQALAAGYFIWDLSVSARCFKIFGPGILAHAVTALLVFSFGFRPYCNYYGPVFILYELSSPFLNIHWFCDKLNLTGSKIQWYNGMLLLGSFFGCRLVWGTYQSLRVYQDTWNALHLNSTDFLNVHSITNPASSILVPRDGQLCLGDQACVAAQAEVMRFAGPGTRAVPIWLAGTYLVCNVTLNALNFFWFGRMVETVKKRFEGKPHDEFKRERGRERRPSIVEEAARGLEHDVLSGMKTPVEEKTVGLSSAMPDAASVVNKRRKDLGR